MVEKRYVAQKSVEINNYSNSGNPKGRECKRMRSMQQPISVCPARTAPPFASITQTVLKLATTKRHERS